MNIPLIFCQANFDISRQTICTEKKDLEEDMNFTVHNNMLHMLCTTLGILNTLSHIHES